MKKIYFSDDTDHRTERHKICVLTSSFPPFQNSAVSLGLHWVYCLHRDLKDKYEFHIIAPYLEGTKKFESIGGMKIYRVDFLGNLGYIRQHKGSMFLRLRKSPFSRSLLALPFYFTGFYLTARRVIKKEKIQLVHAHWTLPAGLVAVLLRKEFICSAEGSDIRLTYNVPVLRNITKFILKKAKVITTIGPETMERIINLGIDARKVFILHQVVDPAMFENVSGVEEIRKKYRLNNVPTVLFVGNLEPLKAPDNVLRAIARVKETLPDIKLLVVGQGSMKAKLEQLAKELGIENNVIFIGWASITEVAKFLKAGDLLTPTMKDTGIAGVQIEAVAAGTPFIGSVPDYFSNLKTVALNADVSNYWDVADKILYFYANQGEISDRLNKNRQLILDDFSQKNRAEKLEKIYQVAIRSKSKGILRYSGIK